jgi:hypothetical protein
MTRIKSSDDITYEQLTSMEKYALCDAAEAHGEIVALMGSREDKRDYASLASKGLLKPVMIKSGRSPEYAYRITQKGWEVYHNREEQP